MLFVAKSHGLKGSRLVPPGLFLHLPNLIAKTIMKPKHFTALFLILIAGIQSGSGTALPREFGSTEFPYHGTMKSIWDREPLHAEKLFEKPRRYLSKLNEEILNDKDFTGSNSFRAKDAAARTVLTNLIQSLSLGAHKDWPEWYMSEETREALEHLEAEMRKFAQNDDDINWFENSLEERLNDKAYNENARFAHSVTEAIEQDFPGEAEQRKVALKQAKRILDQLAKEKKKAERNVMAQLAYEKKQAKLKVPSTSRSFLSKLWGKKGKEELRPEEPRPYVVSP